MTSFAYAQVQGNLGRDPETKSTSTGKKIVVFSLAVEQGYGENKTTGWYNIKVIGTGADFASQHLKKGSNVRLSGDLQIDSWEDKQTGQKRTATVIVAAKVDFGESKTSSSSAPTTRQAAAPPARQQAAPAARAATPTEPNEWDDIEAIPF